MKKKNFTLILLIFILTVSCSKATPVKNLKVKELINEIKKVEYVSSIKVYCRVSIDINIYVEEEFTVDNSLEVLDLAKECFDEETKNELLQEFRMTCPLDIEIMIRNQEGKLVFSFLGSCYKPLTAKNTPPDFDQYEWSYWDNETQSRVIY